ncbi:MULTISPECIES: hypothetical protein [unclassified Nostoc]|uniref:hypothetical protein n=1 Tax=unclassified Nostoc TaxID=2593658 RepID=UPI002AD446BE|nr:hypothetical protein [Nostoc sp. DedQUE03]MDZ7975842.1 hypothetical protein [Nostoc sp. DedQUE03]MDZ8048376.1 hypothetical protein [Nostoc sp. DedQUE02]
MQALPQLIGLQSLESTIDCLLLMVVPKKSLLDAMSTVVTELCESADYAYTLIVVRSQNVLFSSFSRVIEYFTKHDIVLLIASRTSLKTANIFEVMHTSVMTLNVSEFFEIATVVSRLYQQQLDLLINVDNQSSIVANITLETRGKASISSFEVKHHIPIDRQLPKYKWLLARAIVRKETVSKPTHLIGVYEEDLDFDCKCDARVMQTNTPIYHIIMTEILNDVLIIGKSKAAKLEYRPASFNLVKSCRQLRAKVQIKCMFEFFACTINISNILITGLKIAIFIKNYVNISEFKIFVTKTLGFVRKYTVILPLK